MESVEDHYTGLNKAPNEEIISKSKKKRYFFLIIICILIVSTFFLITRKKNHERQNIPEALPTAKPEIKAPVVGSITPRVTKQLVPVSFEFKSEDIPDSPITNIQMSPVITSVLVSPTSSNSNAVPKTVHLNYLFSAYIMTAVISGQTNINQFGIGGLDNAGEKYLITTYFTPADRNADAVFTKNGDKVAFQDQDGLYLYIFSTKEKIKISGPIITNYGGWDRDGNRLSFLQENGGTRQWNIYNYNSKTTQTLPTVFENDFSNFAWMPFSNGFAYNSQLTQKVYVSLNDEIKELTDFNCQGNLMFSQDGRYLTCTNSKWIRMYGVQTGTTIKWDDPNKDWYYAYSSPIWINASYKSADPLLLAHAEGNKLHITSKKRFFDVNKPETKEVVFNTSLKSIILSPGFGIYNIRFINDNQAVSEGSLDGDHGSLLLIEGFANLSYENPNLTIKFLEKNKGLSTHGFSSGSVSIDVK